MILGIRVVTPYVGNGLIYLRIYSVVYPYAAVVFLGITANLYLAAPKRKGFPRRSAPAHFGWAQSW